MSTVSDRDLRAPDAAGKAAQVYTAAEAERYSQANAQTQRELAEAALALLPSLALAAAPALVCDIGCGSGLSGAVIGAAGHAWVGLDVARHMLHTALRADQGCSLVEADISSGLPLRRQVFDASISVSVLQWLKDDLPALARFFRSLHTCLAPGGAASLQFYCPPDQCLSFLTAAEAVFVPASADDNCAGGGVDQGGRGCAGLVFDHPHRTASRKYFLCVQKQGGRHGASEPGEGGGGSCNCNDAQQAILHPAADNCEMKHVDDVRSATSSLRQTEKTSSRNRFELCCPLAFPYPAMCALDWYRIASGSAALPLSTEGGGGGGEHPETCLPSTVPCLRARQLRRSVVEHGKHIYRLMRVGRHSGLDPQHPQQPPPPDTKKQSTSCGSAATAHQPQAKKRRVRDKHHGPVPLTEVERLLVLRCRAAMGYGEREATDLPELTQIELWLQQRGLHSGCPCHATPRH